ncbi:SNF2 domain-containing protein CLASSY 1 [Dichanthelium oligosanthes]|uniref:SNF2 domain-containing protein CLASSY 1 n=1 Tax=Dichanthelium oligosanthes TaxID=888268 RepID=A0A1E5URC6_9POAL|nr:SNF2 domain-containing protein CLASSY 1 [Dichanthelium oligosanthes]
MDPSPPRRCSHLRRALLLAVAALALRLLYGAFLAASSAAANAWPLYPAAATATATARRTYVQADVPSPEAWRTRGWRRAVDYHAAVLAPHLAQGILAPASRAVCLGGAQEALAMRELGVSAAVAVATKRSPPLLVAGHDRRLPFEASSVDFVFAGRALDSAKRPADLAAEAARILKPHAHLVILTSSAADAYSLRSLQALLPALRLLRSRQINHPSDAASTTPLRELVFQKQQLHAHTPNPSSVNNNCSISIGDHKLQLLAHAEPLIREEPLKPWITLKRNINNIKYLPALVDISFKRRYVYIDVGARSYGSSIGSWFRKHYPKQNHTFQVYAIEADPAFHTEYAAKKGVTLLPYAAWVKNETLKFEINGDPGKEDDAKANGRGMGRIRPLAGKKMSGEVVRSVPAFDFAEWLKQTVTEQDYVVMKMDVEGTEFDLIPRLFDTGAICLVDELFLECHYNRWQRCCPGERSPKYDNTYEECLDLFSSLRESGVLVHQWWTKLTIYTLLTAFEAFHNGSWHEVNSIRIRSGCLFVKFVYSGSAVEHNIDGDYLRLHSRKATCLDCSHVLRPGADVCVRQGSSRGETKSSVWHLTIVLEVHFVTSSTCIASSHRCFVLLCAQVPMYRDARLIKIKKKHHTDQCLCLFAVIFYKDQCPGSKGKVMTCRIAEVVTIGDVFILQRLQSGALQDGSVQWSYAEDCLHHNRSKLLSARFSAEVTHLIVLSSLRGMEFNIKAVEGKIIYQITKGDQAHYSVDFMSIPPGFGKNMDVISFEPRGEAIRPRIRTVPVIQVKKHNLTEDGCIVMGELDSAQDVEVLYEHVDLRRSKRMKTQPDRFTSYGGPNFNRTNKKKEENPSSTKNENSQSDLSWDSPVQGESSDEEVLGNPGVKQTVFGPFMIKEDPRSMEAQHKNMMKRTQCSLPVKKKRTSREIEKNTTEQRCSDSHIPLTPAKNKEKCSRPPLSFRLKPITSSHSMGGNSEPAFCQKRGRKRKKHMRETEYKEMIDQCIGNIQCEMERDSDFKLDVQIMNFSGHAYQEEDFTWPSSTDSQEEKDEFEELWKEMDYALASLALLEQKQCVIANLDFQMPDSEDTHDSNTDFGKRGEHCHHDCILDEQLGLTCRLCNIVCTEAKDIFPPMFTGKDHERPERSNFPQDDYALDSSFLEIRAPEFSKSKGSGNVWASISDLEPKLHAHQRKAFEFIWKNLAGSLQLEEMSDLTASRGGCVVAHTPGAGKTLLLISFLVSYLKAHPRSRPLVLTPKGAIHTWRREFETWGISLPLHVLHYSNRRGKPMGTLNSKMQAFLRNFHRPSWIMMRMMDSLDRLCKWHEDPSILLMTYHSFLALTKEDSKLPHRAFMAKVLMNNPGLLILDEGHNPRSNKSKLRKLLMKVKTEFRILLSGTVFQNNFEEYFNTLSLARPRFVNDVMSVLVPEAERETRNRSGKHQEALARRIFVEKVGQKIESSSIYDRMNGISLLNKLTCGFIDSFDGSKTNNLPGIRVYTLFMKPTDIQEEVLAKVTMPVPGNARYPLEVELLITIASIHPWLIKTTNCASTYFTQEEVGRVEKYKRNYAVGCKSKFVIDLLHKSSFRGERVLIFCHNVSPINFLVKLIEIVFGWRLGEEVLVLQGDQELPVRSDVMDKFNCDRKGERKVLIASTTACAEGISLTGASRLVMLDSEWNHSKTMQAIARAFRPGQERMVYVYLLVASGTWEEDKYNSNRRKAWIAKMVFFGRYVDEPLQNRVTEIDDQVLKELADEDETKTFHMIVKQDWECF